MEEPQPIPIDPLLKKLGCLLALFGLPLLLAVFMGPSGLMLYAAIRGASQTHHPFGTPSGEIPLWLLGTLGATALGDLVVLFSSKKAQAAWWVFHEIRFVTVVESFLLILLTAGLALGLRVAFPILDISWLYLFTGKAGNIAVLPLLSPQHLSPLLTGLGVVYLCLFAATIPAHAASEERDFRNKTRDWPHAIRRSLRFGIGHCRMGVPLFVGLALTLPGLWLSYRYFRGGVRAATVSHATYNLLLTVLGTIALILLAVPR